jgi:hypothetical protein
MEGIRMRTPPRFVLAVALVATIGLSGCINVDVDGDDGGDSVRGSGDMVTESREVSGFDEIAVFGSGEVVVDVTGTESLSIEAEDNIMPLLTTEVRNGVLELEVEGNVSPTRDITYTITAATLTGVSIAGSGDVTATDVESDEFEVEIAGSGDVSPAGTVGALSIEIAGSGRYRGEDLMAASAAVEVAGSGDVVVNATDELAIVIAGSGSVEYLGTPTVEQSVSGSGEVSQR